MKKNPRITQLGRDVLAADRQPGTRASPLITQDHPITIKDIQEAIDRLPLRSKPPNYWGKINFTPRPDPTRSPSMITRGSCYLKAIDVILLLLLALMIICSAVAHA